MFTEKANNSDIFQLKKLWKQGFGDSDEFIEWYFSHRFDPELTSVTRDGERIISMAYCQPMTVRMRDKLIPAAMLNGVFTLPEYRKKGLMHENVLLLEKACADTAMPVMINTPAGKNHYHTLGHRYITSCERKTLPLSSGSKPKITEDISSYCGTTLKVYNAMSEKYSCMIHRDISAQQERFSDYASDGAKLVLHHDENILSAYAIVYELEDKFLCPECIYVSTNNGILDALSRLGKPCTVKLPSDTTPTAVGCITDAASLLPLMELPYSVELTDNKIAKNNGIFSLDGQPHKPVMKIPTASLIQLLAGYLDFSEICDIIIYCEKGCKELARLLPKQQCYMIEEY